MVLEIADIRILPGQQAGFEAAIANGVATVLPKAAGFIRAQVHHCVETPERYVLQIEWESIEAHNVGFRQGPLFIEWRGLIGSYFAQPPLVEHFDRVV
jgi:heme-degrading monooxygenase HmoA